MKRSVLLAVVMMATVAAFGQYRQTAGEVKLTPTQRMNSLNPKASSEYRGGISEMFVWYGSTEGEIYGTPQTEFIWDLHSRADSADLQFQYVIVTYPTLQAWDDPNGTSVIDWNNVISATVDTVWIQMGHENNSGQLDTVNVQIVSLDGQGRPTTNVLWEESITTDTSFTGGDNWTNSVFRPFLPNLTLNEPFGVRVNYFGSKQDTFGIVAGFYEDGICTGTTPKALESLFPNNSFRLLSQYDFAGLLPQAAGGDIYYDCNANNAYDPGIDGEHFTQNINFGVSLTIEDDIAVEELPSALTEVKNFPNPFSQFTNIEYTLDNSANVSLEVYDLTGAVVFSTQAGQQMPGTHTIQVDGSGLAEGIYYYSLNVNGGTITKKMVLTR